MALIFGSILVCVCVAGGYILSHGQMYALWQPNELIIICGAALGAFIIANPGRVIKATISRCMGLLGGPKYNKKSYLELLALMFSIFGKARKEGMMAIEADIEEPEASEIFSKYPKILKDHHVMEFISDYLRIIVGGNMNAFELENLMDIEMETHHHEENAVPGALQAVADGLPGFGIVAAVLGIVITMGAISGTAEEIGHHVGAALVGTFLGILMAYGFVAPMSTAIGNRVAGEHKIFDCLKVCLLSTVNGYSPQVAVEFGRKTLASGDRPSFSELEAYLKDNK